MTSLAPQAPVVAACAWLGALAGLLATGCSGAPLAQAAMPNDGHDPSQLARCRVAASQDQPLVTEWPAPYKARLEAKLLEGAVAVEYSGCEMKIVDRCVVSGSYAWKKTTLSTDTTSIRNEDELYAKLPLGAALLSGELRSSGSLEVQTTVAGQMALEGRAAEDATTGAECARATHLVMALSVGAFELVAGGDVSGGAGIEVAGVGAEASTKQSKSIVRSAGDAARCGDATDEAPSPDCRSPLQMFLSPIRRRVPLETLSPLPDEG
jgi:hypothetical protein